MTLTEFAHWMCLEIAGRYHHDTHRMLGTTPGSAWAASLAGGVISILPAEPSRFLISFLPVIRRRIQRNGLLFEKIRYWSDILPTIAQPHEQLVVRYDPRNLSSLLVMGKNRRYHRVPNANVTRPAISLGELRHIRAQLRSQSKNNIDENMLFATHEKQRQIVASAASTTKATRRRAEAARRAKQHTQSVAGSIDFTQEAAPLPMELWDSVP